MTTLDQFHDKGFADGKYVKAYCMDNTDKNISIPDMRRHAGLGACNCCDYFFIKGDKVFLIEKTKLWSSIEYLNQKYSYLKEHDRESFINKRIMQENYIKVYGTMLVLSRLAIKCKTVAAEVENKKYVFWLVVDEDAGSKNSGESIHFQQLTTNLFSDLRGKLSKEMLDDVEVIPSKKTLFKMLKKP